MTQKAGVTITLDDIYKKLEGVEASQNQILTETKLQTKDIENLNKRVEAIEKHERWAIGIIVSAVITGIMSAYFF
ncbi:hypothetical protein [Mechercharimyces sp. CAU 1602]|uniref:hypothetical protein n=1 Tax=Mechercharimyces sp. CAU 1602 TaxID=2973933 RepID=UPI0021628202|nr:hypothetical protein [Mechercharimyces sp. CAU 1602]MCS1351139.1 hypothetical protein [Mechercharimyces sp. CAU 1602]